MLSSGRAYGRCLGVVRKSMRTVHAGYEARAADGDAMQVDT